jgi:hypothetical protein
VLGWDRDDSKCDEFSGLTTNRTAMRALIAQLVEHVISNNKVCSSNLH